MDDPLTAMQATIDQFGAYSRLIAHLMAEYRKHLVAMDFPDEEVANLLADFHQIWWETQMRGINK